MVYIIGAGLTGLTTSYFLNKHGLRSTILEKDNHIGGLCSSFHLDKFEFEMVQHFIHLRDLSLKDFIEQELKIPLNKYERKAFIFFKNRWIPYPFQANLSSLPIKERVECFKSFIQARLASYQHPSRKDDNFLSYSKWSKNTFGNGITRHFMIPYNEKVWNFSAEKLTTEWMGKFVPTPTFKEIAYSFFFKQKHVFGYNSTFYYPKEGSISLLPNALNLDNVLTNEPVTRINLKKKLITTPNKIYSFQTLINTMPLDQLIASIEECPEEIANASIKLKKTGIYVLNVGFKSNSLVDSFNWCYFPENKYLFYRLGIASNINPALAPNGFSSCYIEFNETVFANKNANAIISRVIHQLLDLKIIGSKSDLVTQKLIHVTHAYVIFDKNHRTNVAKILNYLASHNVQSIGRFGNWEYSYIEKNMKDGIKIADDISKRFRSHR